LFYLESEAHFQFSSMRAKLQTGNELYKNNISLNFWKILPL
jgi:hypothetical protein